jgi:carboxymethylenebutenolidase
MPSRKYRIVSVIGASLLVGIALGFLVGRRSTNPQGIGGSAVADSPMMKKQDLGSIFDAHVKHEFVDHDVEATMRTMVAEPYVHNVPMLTGGVGSAGVRSFYEDQFVGRMPADTKVVPVSRTVGEKQVVDELILSFTHDVELDYMLPGIPPTGRYVELPHVVVMKFEGDKIAHEHIYWDQASLLVQVGLLDSKHLPAVGAEQAKRLRELSERSNLFRKE